MSISEKQILDALSTVEEPDLKQDLVTLKMIEDVNIEHKKVSFTVVLTTPACPLKELIEKRCIDAIHRDVDDSLEVIVNMISRNQNTNSTKQKMPNVQNIICVTSGKGGVGKSSVSVLLAEKLSQMGAKVGILDADIHGPSIPTMMGMKNLKPETRKIKDKIYILPIEKNENFKVLSIGFLVDERQAIVWRGPMVASALRQFVTDVIWGELDYLIIDMPPGTGDVQLSIAQLLPVTCSIIVSTPQEVAVTDAKKALSMFRVEGVKIPVAGIIENMAYFVPEDMPDKKYHIFGEGGAKNLAEEYEVPFLGELPINIKIRENMDSGGEHKFNDAINESIKTIVDNLVRQVSIVKNKKQAESVA